MKNKTKRVIIAVIAFSILFSTINVSAKVYDKNININARSAVAIDSKTKIILYDKNSQMIVPMASTTKIMTALVAIKYGDLNKKVTISQRAASMRGSTVGYRKGEEISILELLYGLMLRSGNDAAIAISEGVAGSVEEFLKLMNEYALEIGLINSHFESPHGLDSLEHYSSAYDLAYVTSKAKEEPIFNQIVSTKTIDSSSMGFTRSYQNINKILWQLPEADGVKTGYTGGAGKCLVTSAKYGDRDLIIVVLNCTPRWNETIKIYNYITKNYEYKTVIEKDKPIDKIILNNNHTVDLYSKEDIIIPEKSGCSYDVKINKSQDVKLPIVKGENLGSVDILKDGEIVYSKPLYANQNINNSFIKKIIDKIKNN